MPQSESQGYSEGDRPKIHTNCRIQLNLFLEILAGEFWIVVEEINQKSLAAVRNGNKQDR